MVRTYSDRPLEHVTITELLDLARRAPSAGNTQAVRFLVLTEPVDVARYWNTTMSAEGQDSFRWQSMLRAPAIVLVLTDPKAYLERYSETDKSATGRGSSSSEWPVPFWWVDAGAVIQNLLLGATAAGLGACLFGTFDHEQPVKDVFDIPASMRIAGAITLGYPGSDQPGRSTKRVRPPLDEVVSFGAWRREPSVSD